VDSAPASPGPGDRRHADIKMTPTIYAHAALNEDRAALRKLGDALG
jgi:hypothetical protein